MQLNNVESKDEEGSFRWLKCKVADRNPTNVSLFVVKRKYVWREDMKVLTDRAGKANLPILFNEQPKARCKSTSANREHKNSVLHTKDAVDTDTQTELPFYSDEIPLIVDACWRKQPNCI